MATEVMNLDTLPYYVFKGDGSKRFLEGRFWNQDGKHIAIVAVINQYGEHGDWAAYIGTDAPDSYTEDATLNVVAAWGCKLSEGDARHFFPDIELPYRY